MYRAAAIAPRMPTANESSPATVRRAADVAMRSIGTSGVRWVARTGPSTPTLPSAGRDACACLRRDPAVVVLGLRAATPAGLPIPLVEVFVL
jgi:hypothetical protein